MAQRSYADRAETAARRILGVSDDWRLKGLTREKTGYTVEIGPKPPMPEGVTARPPTWGETTTVFVPDTDVSKEDRCATER